MRAMPYYSDEDKMVFHLREHVFIGKKNRSLRKYDKFAFDDTDSIKFKEIDGVMWIGMPYVEDNIIFLSVKETKEEVFQIIKDYKQQHNKNKKQ